LIIAGSAYVDGISHTARMQMRNKCKAISFASLDAFRAAMSFG